MISEAGRGSHKRSQRKAESTNHRGLDSARSLAICSSHLYRAIRLPKTRKKRGEREEREKGEERRERGTKTTHSQTTQLEARGESYRIIITTTSPFSMIPRCSQSLSRRTGKRRSDHASRNTDMAMGVSIRNLVARGGARDLCRRAIAALPPPIPLATPLTPLENCQARRQRIKRKGL